MDYQEILDFWFDELTPDRWWKKDPTLDSSMESRFGIIHRQAIQGELSGWRNSAEGALAEIIVLDQFFHATSTGTDHNRLRATRWP